MRWCPSCDLLWLARAIPLWAGDTDVKLCSHIVSKTHEEHWNSWASTLLIPAILRGFASLSSSLSNIAVLLCACTSSSRVRGCGSTLSVRTGQRGLLKATRLPCLRFCLPGASSSRTPTPRWAHTSASHRAVQNSDALRQSTPSTSELNVIAIIASL